MSEDDAIDASVAVHGWHAIAIDDADPPFLYTCGLLTRSNHPELIILGLERQTAYAVAADVVGLVRDGRRFDTPGAQAKILAGLDVSIRPVDRTQHELYLGYAMAHARRHDVPLAALQIFWPDNADRFPFELECDPEVRQLQPRLELRASTSELRAFRRRFGPK